MPQIFVLVEKARGGFPPEPVIRCLERDGVRLPTLLQFTDKKASNKKPFEAASSGIIGFLIGITTLTTGDSPGRRLATTRILSETCHSDCPLPC